MTVCRIQNEKSYLFVVDTLEVNVTRTSRQYIDILEVIFTPATGCPYDGTAHVSCWRYSGLNQVSCKKEILTSNKGKEKAFFPPTIHDGSVGIQLWVEKRKEAIDVERGKDRLTR